MDAADSDTAAFWEVAGFITTPEETDVEQVDADELRAQLLKVAAISADHCKATTVVTSPTTAFYEALRTDWAEDLVADTFSPADIRRAYGDYAVPMPSCCTTLVVAFGSLTKAYHAKQHHGEATFEFVGVCERLQIGHALFLRDPLQAWFLRPGADGFEAALALLSREIAALAPKRFLAVGSSMGGYAAIRAAVAVGAAHPGLGTSAVAFGPQIFINPSEREALQLPPMEFDPELAALKGRVPLTSLVDVMAGALPGGTRVDIHCGAVSRGDVLEAQLLQQRHHQNVNITVHRQCAHCVAAHIGRGNVDAIISRFVSPQTND